MLTPAMKNAQFWTLLTCLTALLDKQHRMVIEYLKEENRILQEHIHKKHGVIPNCPHNN